MQPTELTDLTKTRHILSECLEVFSDNHKKESLIHTGSMLTQAAQDTTVIDISNCMLQLDRVGIEVSNTKEEILKLLSIIDSTITKKSEYLLHSNFPSPDANNDWCEILKPEWELTNRQALISDELRSAVSGHINQYSDFRYPALEIGPGQGDWTEELVGFDPLYLVDYHESMFDLIKQKFNSLYARRLRFYCNRADPFDFSMLPLGQFGFIFAWNVFDFYRYQNLNKILHSCFDLLKPGGHILFSYNNCEHTVNANAAETKWKSWMNTRLLRNCCENTGLEFKDNRNVDRQYFCILKKPGELKTVKIQQAIGKIFTKNT